MGLEGKRVAVLIEDEYQLQEFNYPFYRLMEEGADVEVIGTNRADAFSSHGYTVKADLKSADAKAEDFDAVIVPGGYAPDKMRVDADMVAFVRAMDGAGKPVAAICHAGWVLVSAKIVKGRKVTSVRNIRDDMEAAGGLWSDEEVVVDGNLITSRTPGDLPAFAKAVVNALAQAPATVG